MKRLSRHSKIPSKAYATDAGIDLYACNSDYIAGYGKALVGTGVAIEIPEGYCLLVRDRSGFVTRTRCSVVAGVIDSGYRGEIKIAFENHSPDGLQINAGDKIAQALLLPVPVIEILEVDSLQQSERGDGGFGSTGST